MQNVFKFHSLIGCDPTGFNFGIPPASKPPSWGPVLVASEAEAVLVVPPPPLPPLAPPEGPDVTPPPTEGADLSFYRDVNWISVNQIDYWLL